MKCTLLTSIQINCNSFTNNPKKKLREKHDYFISSKSKKIVSVKSKVTMCQMFFIYRQTSSFSMLNQF